MFLVKCFHKFAKNNKERFFDGIIILRFDETKVAKENFNGLKNDEYVGC